MMAKKKSKSKKVKSRSRKSSKKAQSGKIIMFYGTECAHCHNVMPIVDRLNKEGKVRITKLEVWHNDKNAAFMEKVDKGFCGGVPFFYNENTGEWICGETDYDTLKTWAMKKK